MSLFALAQTIGWPDCDEKYAYISEICLPTFREGFVRLSHYLEWLHTTYASV
jgi:hypothetical protein